ncbi:MAG: aspartate 1-decarboxylase [Candidatus Kapaibacterium sp.]|jgi:aspartate 1-decarboxylase
MLRTFFKSKIHRAVITQAELHYEGSCTIDLDLMDAAGLLPYEQIAIVNINNGERFETYVIPGERGSKSICLNGAAARKGQPGDRVIIISYAQLSQEEIPGFKPTIILVDETNSIIEKSHAVEAHRVVSAS